MKPVEELSAQLWPFRPVEIYGFTNRGARFVFSEPGGSLAELIYQDVWSCKQQLAAELKAVRNPRVDRVSRKRAAARITELRRELVRLHLRLRQLSIGFRTSAHAPTHYWP